MSIVATLVVLLATTVWALAYRATVHHPLDTIALTWYLFALQLLWRPLVLATGLDDAFPDRFFADVDVASTLISSQWLVIVYAVSLAVGARTIGAFTRPLDHLLPNPPALPTRALLRFGAVATAAAALITVVLVVRQGGIADLITARKINRDLRGTGWLRMVPIIGAAAGGAAALSTRSIIGARRGPAIAGIGIWTINSAFVFVWGARDTAVYGLAALLLGTVLYGRGGDQPATNETPAEQPGRWSWLLPAPGVWSWWTTDRRIARIATVGVIVVAGAFTLRIGRDLIMHGAPLDSIADAQPVRQVAVATNNTQFDALMMARSAWPDESIDDLAADQIDALRRATPFHALGSPSGPYEPPPIQIAHAYDPDRASGLPPTPVGEWWMNGGLLGVIVGGLVSGVALRSAQRRFDTFTSNPLTWMVMFVMVGTVFPLGLLVASVFRYKLMVLPLLVVMWLLGRPGSRRLLARDT